MNEMIEVIWTAGSLDEARKISRLLVEKKLVASAQIIPWIESVYKLNGELETVQESKISLKTKFQFFDEIRSTIELHSKYEIPEIIFYKIEGGNEAYFKWIDNSLK